MTRPTSLDPAFIDGNVALGVLFGAMSACATVRALLPAPTPSEPASVSAHNPREVTQVRVSEESEEIDPFVALLLGTVVLHERLSAISDPGRDGIDRAHHRVGPAASLGELLR
jgi:hypothetical protein